MAVVLSIAGALTAVPASARPLPCAPGDYYPTVICGTSIPSQRSSTLTRKGSCYGWRQWYAFDRSRRVNLWGKAHWVAPGKFRIRAYGSPLGPLSVTGHIYSTHRVKLWNFSRFPVLVRFAEDCP